MTFRLPQERESYEAHYNGPAYLSVLRDLDEILRRAVKDDTHYNAQSARNILWELMADEGLTLD